MKNRLNLNRLDQPPPRPPPSLSGSARNLWQSLRTDFAIRDSAGLAILTTACEAFRRMKEAEKMLASEGLIFRDARGQLKPHPAVQIERDCRTQFLVALKQLHLDIEPLERLMGRPGGGAKPKLQLTQVK